MILAPRGPRISSDLGVGSPKIWGCLFHCYTGVLVAQSARNHEVLQNSLAHVHLANCCRLQHARTSLKVVNGACWLIDWIADVESRKSWVISSTSGGHSQVTVQSISQLQLGDEYYVDQSKWIAIYYRSIILTLLNIIV